MHLRAAGGEGILVLAADNSCIWLVLAAHGVESGHPQQLWFLPFSFCSQKIATCEEERDHDRRGVGAPVPRFVTGSGVRAGDRARVFGPFPRPVAFA